VPAAERKPIWLLPNLLSLDAPLVAIAWLYVFAKTWRLGYHPWEAYASLGLAVWIIYVSDRLLDASLLIGGNERMEERHRFHWRYRKLFRAGLALAVAFAVGLVVMRMPMAIYKHLLLGGVMVAGFFGLAMLASQEPREVPHAKNILAGLTFAFGVAMMAHLYRYEYDVYDLLLRSREFVCFVVLCILNISAIDLWEHAARSSDRETKASDELALTLPLTLLGAAALIFAMLESQQSSRPFYYAILSGAGLLYALNRIRARFRMETLRVLADVALLVPVLVFLAASQSPQ
jgi:FtsH-binding integral membrane protein